MCCGNETTFYPKMHFACPIYHDVKNLGFISKLSMVHFVLVLIGYIVAWQRKELLCLLFVVVVVSSLLFVVCCCFITKLSIVRAGNWLHYHLAEKMGTIPREWRIVTRSSWRDKDKKTINTWQDKNTKYKKTKKGNRHGFTRMKKVTRSSWKDKSRMKNCHWVLLRKKDKTQQDKRQKRQMSKRQ